jgi:hypothetical protein
MAVEQPPETPPSRPAKDKPAPPPPPDVLEPEPKPSSTPAPPIAKQRH